MKLFLSVCIILAICSCSQLPKVEQNPVDVGRGIVKIQALSKTGKQNLGSGIIIAANKIATNCHVTRTANRINIIENEGFHQITAQAVLPEFDVCILETDHLDSPPAELADSETTKVGDDIILSGYPLGLNLRMMRGKVIGLHPYGDDEIIEINTGFNHGASGGGVFDSSGKLIGLMTFMGPEDGVIHFYAIPAEWLAIGLEKDFMPLKPFSGSSFWEKGGFVKHISK